MDDTSKRRAVTAVSATRPATGPTGRATGRATGRPPHRPTSPRRWRFLSLAISLGALLGLLSSLALWSAPATRFLFQDDPTTPIASGIPPGAGTTTPALIPAVEPNPIQAENALPGTTAWRIPEALAAKTEIQGYAGAESAAPGQTLTFYISVQYPHDSYTVDIYRLGWYGGAGGRLMRSFSAIGQNQGYYDWAAFTIDNCPTCTIDPATHMVDAGWKPSFQVTIPANWVSGLYVAKLTTSGGKQAYVHFTVTGDPHSTYIATMPDNTTEAYNDWGGYSLYHGPDQRLATRAFKVSLNRPALGWRFGYGAGLTQVIDAIRWLERNGYDVSYISTVDLHEHPEQLLTHRAYLSLGHDEYWSAAMRDGVEFARDSGVGLAFFGANAAYWNIRFEADRAGHLDRVIVCYKSAILDPLYGKDNAHVTVEWRQAPLNRPENALVGVMYADYVVPPLSWAWTVAPGAGSSPLLANTGLKPGASYGCNLVGYEFDHIYNNGQSPSGIQVLGQSYTDGLDYGPDISQTTYYVARSGAFVFASGSIYWEYALDALHIWDVPNVYNDFDCLLTSRSAPIPGIQTLMQHVMQELVESHLPRHKQWRPSDTPTESL